MCRTPLNKSSFNLETLRLKSETKINRFEGPFGERGDLVNNYGVGGSFTRKSRFNVLSNLFY